MYTYGRNDEWLLMGKRRRRIKWKKINKNRKLFVEHWIWRNDEWKNSKLFVEHWIWSNSRITKTNSVFQAKEHIDTSCFSAHTATATSSRDTASTADLYLLTQSTLHSYNPYAGVHLWWQRSLPAASATPSAHACKNINFEP